MRLGIEKEIDGFKNEKKVSFIRRAGERKSGQRNRKIDERLKNWRKTLKKHLVNLFKKWVFCRNDHDTRIERNTRYVKVYCARCGSTQETYDIDSGVWT